MRFSEVNAKNFGSFKEISLNLEGKGLTLVTGPTGAGKSTLFDIIPWVLYGVTAKNGKADEIIAWGKKSTAAWVTFTTGSDTITVCRSRGPTDLYIQKNGTVPIRGKDLLDTQKQINELIGMEAEAFIGSNYLHEFSPAANFFQASAKDRRALTEDLTDLSFPTHILKRASEHEKKFSELQEDLEKEVYEIVVEKKFSDQNLSRVKTAKLEWDESKDLKIEQLKISSKSFIFNKEREIEKALDEVAQWNGNLQIEIKELQDEISALDIIDLGESVSKLAEIDAEIMRLSRDKCSECGGAKNSNKILVLTKDKNTRESLIKNLETQKYKKGFLERRLQKCMELVNPHIEYVRKAQEAKNTFATELKTLKKQVNPHTERVGKLSLENGALANKLSEVNGLLEDIKIDRSDIEVLKVILADLRAKLIIETVQNLENETNHYLGEYFDAEIKIRFEVDGADKISVTIQKDGNECVFAQLSRGQRQLLKLCFGVSVMKTLINRYYGKIQYLFLDEMLTGLDENMKIKAFKLFSKLATEHESVFVIEHSDSFKELFPNRINITLENGHSQCQP